MQKEHFFSPNSGEEQKKTRSSLKFGRNFYPKLGEEQKKRSSLKFGPTFLPKLGKEQKKGLHLKVHPFKLLGGYRDGPFSNYWRGYSQIIGGIYPPIPPGFPNPCSETSLSLITIENPLITLLGYFELG